MYRFQKKIMVGIVITALSCTVLACSTGSSANNGSGAKGQAGGRSGYSGEPETAEAAQNGSDTTDAAIPADAAGAEGGQAGGLAYLCEPDSNGACSTAQGYYYLTGEGEKLADGTYGNHLMYMDYATRQEIYLCSTAGCGHDTPDCPAVLPWADFPSYSTKLFVFRDGLYILSRESDMDGSMSVNLSGGEAPGTTPEAEPAVLYRANLDGTGRRAVYTFAENLTLEDLVLGNENGIYLITKEVSVEREGEASYATSSRRKLVCLDPDQGALEEICSLEFEDPISWNVVGCSGNRLVLYGVDYGKELSREEMWEDDSHKELFRNSHGVYAVLDLETGEKEELLRLSNQQSHSVQVVGEQLYFSSEDSSQLKSLNLSTREEKVLCELPQNQLLGCLGELLCCRSWDLSGDFTWYFVDIGTGEVSHSSLVNLRNGWSLEFRADLAGEVLVVYDYDAEEYGDGSYEIYQYKYALIAKEDLLAGRDNYRKIEMIGKGE